MKLKPRKFPVITIRNVEARRFNRSYRVLNTILDWRHTLLVGTWLAN